MRKKTQEEIEEAYEKKGFCLNDEYKGATEKMNVVCPKGHAFLSRWASFNSGKGCPECAKKVRADKKRTPETLVRKALADRGYSMVGKYKGNLKPLNFVCPEGHEGSMTWASFKDGHGCKKCGAVRRGRLRRKEAAKKAISRFRSEGYEPLSEYQDSHSLIDFVCPDGHRSSMSWTNFDTGHRCVYCSKNSPVTTEIVKDAFASEGYKLLEPYRSNRSRMRFKCPKGHLYSISWANWGSGHRCAVCSGFVVTHRSVKNAIEGEGYQMLSTYRNNLEQIKVVCPAGHEGGTSWANFQSGNRCRTCFKPEVSHQEVRNAFKDAAYKLLGDYTKSSEKLRYECPEGHQYSITWDSFKRGRRCPECSGRIVHHKDVQAAFEEEGYQLLSEYKGSHEYLHYVCPEGHRHKITWGSFRNGARCGYCARVQITAEQREINKIKKSIRGLIQHHMKKQGAERSFSKAKFAERVAIIVKDNLGSRPDGSHLDHVVPQAFFDFRNQEEVEACWDIENLQWLPAMDNVRKGHKVSREDVAKFSEEQAKILQKASRKPLAVEKHLQELWPGLSASIADYSSEYNSSAQVA